MDIVRIRHGYDSVGNHLNRQDAVNTAWSEDYAYDQMDQIASMSRTDHTESWQYDETGNWLAYTKNGTSENRIHNAVNEVLNICQHDANGNMTRMPKPNGDGNLDCVYDAWNRMVGVNDNIRYRYDGRNFRIEKTVGEVSAKSFFNRNWQELELTTNNVTTTYVWGLRYIDDLVCRERENEKLFSLADPNWNVVALTDDQGAVQNRFNYDAFGRVSGLSSDWNRTFTGQVIDAKTGLMIYRNRYYHAGLGRFVHRDPIGYEAEDVNLFRYVSNAPSFLTDSSGLSPFSFMPSWSSICRRIRNNLPSTPPRNLAAMSHLSGLYLRNPLLCPAGTCVNTLSGNPTINIPYIFDFDETQRMMDEARERIKSYVCDNGMDADGRGFFSNVKFDANDPDTGKQRPYDLFGFVMGTGDLNASIEVSTNDSKQYNVTITWKYTDKIKALTQDEITARGYFLDESPLWLQTCGMIEGGISAFTNLGMYPVEATKTENFIVNCCD